MKKISIIAPVYNEELLIGQFYNELKIVLDSLSDRYKTEIIFVLDGCTDTSFKILSTLADIDNNLKILTLSRRYGHQNSIIAGMDNSEADILIMMDSDLQHPPELIYELLTAHESGYDIVHAVRNSPQNLSIFDRYFSKLFYKFINLISDANAIEGAADFRLISRKVSNIFKTEIRERDQFLRGLFIWAGFRQCSIPYFASKRALGNTKYSFFRKIDFALTGLISFSLRPLKILTILGLTLSLLSVLFVLFILTAYFFGNQFPPGWGTIIVIICLIGGIQLFFLGIMCQYLVAILKEVKGRPIYLVESKYNFIY